MKVGLDRDQIRLPGQLERPVRRPQTIPAEPGQIRRADPEFLPQGRIRITVDRQGLGSISGKLAGE
jgi:hypothetical protein